MLVAFTPRNGLSSVNQRLSSIYMNKYVRPYILAVLLLPLPPATGRWKHSGPSTVSISFYFMHFSGEFLFYNILYILISFSAFFLARESRPAFFIIIFSDSAPPEWRLQLCATIFISSENKIISNRSKVAYRLVVDGGRPRMSELFTRMMPGSRTHTLTRAHTKLPYTFFAIFIYYRITHIKNARIYVHVVRCPRAHP